MEVVASIAPGNMTSRWPLQNSRIGIALDQRDRTTKPDNQVDSV